MRSRITTLFGLTIFLAYFGAAIGFMPANGQWLVLDGYQDYAFLCEITF